MTIPSTIAVGLHAFDAEIVDLQNAVLGLLGSFVSSVLAIANGSTNSGTALSGSSIIISNGTQIVQGAAGTTTTLLHGNAAGAPTYAGVSLTADTTANQGTVTTVLHGNAAGQPSFAAVSLAADVTGVAPIANGGTNSTATATNGGVGYGTGSAHAYSAAGTSGQLMQSAGAASPVWAGDTAWTAPTLTNSWVNYGGNSQPAGYLKDASGVVHIRGMIKSGTVATPAFTVAAGYRPAVYTRFPVTTNSAFGFVGIDSDGTVNMESVSNAWVDFGGITFDTR